MKSDIRTLLKVGGAVATLTLAACATVPAGPSVGALPGSKKSWDQFQADDASCRGYAVSVSGSPNDAAAQAGVGSAVAGTLIGAAIGGLVGGNQGAAVGAGMGLFTGSAVGVGNAQAAGSVTQQRYDGAYYQCMYGLGNRVPAPAGYVAEVSGWWLFFVISAFAAIPSLFHYDAKRHVPEGRVTGTVPGTKA